MDQLLKEYEGQKQTRDQLYTSYQGLKRQYLLKEEEVSRLDSQCSKLQAEIKKQNVELCENKQELKDLSGLREFVQTLHEKLVMAERDRDNATAMLSDQKESQQKMQIEIEAKIVKVQGNYIALNSQIKSKDTQIASLIADKESTEKRLTLVSNSKDLEIAELNANVKDLEKKLVQKHTQVVASTPTTTHTDADSCKETEVLQGCSNESIFPSSSSLVLIANRPENQSVLLKQREQTIKELHKEIAHLQKQQAKSLSNTGVGEPCMEHTSGVSC